MLLMLHSVCPYLSDPCSTACEKCALLRINPGDLIHTTKNNSVAFITCAFENDRLNAISLLK